eukprot:TRINITY_DN1605_c0_g1_i1.p1 TRINITY_DN1605_c0_g1~~TRINITY_DN1605_c0_g1_i1.p1  ORF type:complete len:449 (+),score=104.58 TRINITY_DN1605_c0_g1_i1:24-1370(+)
MLLKTLSRGLNRYKFSQKNQRCKIHTSPLPNIEIPTLSPFTDYLLDDALDHHSDVAMIEAETGNTLTYEKFKERVHWFGIHYYIRGWDQGEILAMAMHNHEVYPLSVLGAAKVGLPVSLVNTKYKSRMWVKQMKNSPVKMIITSQSLRPHVNDACASLRGLKEILILDREEDPEKKTRFSIEMKYNLLFDKPPGWGALPDYNVTSAENCLLAYTDEGTKGVALTHQNVATSLAQLNAVEDLTNKDVVIASLPLYQPEVFLTSVCLPLYKGAKFVLMKEFNVEQFVANTEKYSATFAHLTSFNIEQLTTSSSSSNISSRISTLKTVLCTEIINESLISSFKQKFPHITLKQGFSVNNITPPILYNPSSKSKVGSNGVLLPNTEAKIVEHESRVLLGHGKVGEILVRGPQLMNTIHNNQELTQNSFDSDGFFKTGHYGRVDEDGFFYIVK